MKRILRAATAAMALASMAACGPTREANDTPAGTSSPIAVRENVAVADPEPVNDVGGMSTPDNATPIADAVAPGERGIVSCSAELGKAAAARLVQQCRALSPATHPPCNARNSCALVRSEISRSCSVIAENGTAPNDCPAPPQSAAAAVEIIRNYYSAIDARDYATAWAMWDGDGERSGKSLDAFTAGFRSTVSSSVAPGSPGRVEGAAGSAYVTVPVTVRARLSDGTRQRFTGSYVLRRSNVERSQGWAIYSATLKQG